MNYMMFDFHKMLTNNRKHFAEVRTPLNAVSMGLDLMQSEIAQALGFENSSSYWTRRQSIRSVSSSRDLMSDIGAVQSQDQKKVGISLDVAREWFELTQEIQGEFFRCFLFCRSVVCFRSL